jgi:hypothetical protein
MLTYFQEEEKLTATHLENHDSRNKMTEPLQIQTEILFDSQASLMLFD